MARQGHPDIGRAPEFVAPGVVAWLDGAAEEGAASVANRLGWIETEPEAILRAVNAAEAPSSRSQADLGPLAVCGWAVLRLMAAGAAQGEVALGVSRR